MLHIGPTTRQAKQIGAARLSMIFGTVLDCDQGYRILSAAKAADQVALIDRLLHSPVGDLRLEVQKERIAKRSERQSMAARSVRKQDALVANGLAAILKDDRRLSDLCRELAGRGDQPGPMAFAGKAFAIFAEKILEAELSASDRILVAKNRTALLQNGIDPDAQRDTDDDANESTWERTARTRGAFAFRDSYIDAPAYLSSEEEGLSS